MELQLPRDAAPPQLARAAKLLHVQAEAALAAIVARHALELLRRLFWPRQQPCSRADAGATEAWCSRASKQPAAPAAGPYAKGPPAAATTRMAEAGSPSSSAVSLTTTV
eukprot:scaffold111516_cov39-Phaeocystis_antarctica.AAC.5